MREVQEFIPGQRWISTAELQLGLGTILSSEHRTVDVLFLATGDTRTYSRETAPLRRVSFVSGDTIRDHEGRSLKIDKVHEANGLFTYIGTRDDGVSTTLSEAELDNFTRLNRPTDRLFSGQIDKDKWFSLRHETLGHINRLAHSELRGLGGVRTSLIPHQLYIAHEVANRFAPRVLLADEVGLGKTIEAGLILHHQLLTERAHRALIVVPESLVHQWLVEMLRRFNLHFSIFNEQRCEAIEDSSGQENPFDAEQLVLCSLDFLAGDPRRAAQVLASDWDLLVVDEAHHLQWSPEESSTEYQLVEKLAAETGGVLLLTATPEQLGKASHFARLRLLDPGRFPDYEAFVVEEESYEPIAAVVEALMNNAPLGQNAQLLLRKTIPEGDNRDYLDTLEGDDSSDEEKTVARERLVEHLLDRHGTGRVLFRNTRSAVKGFPQREAISHSLPQPEQYSVCFEAFENDRISEPQLLLSPELIYSAIVDQDAAAWSEFDPRIPWLGEQLKAIKPGKVLVIAADADTAADIAEALRNQYGIHAALFHEGMSIIERDRAAAWFADHEYGSQVMVCSEIGSEGRNFQFAHHMVLFDLPLNPDLLEQRIGRLDRIGQSEAIRIHIPYLEGSPQETMFHWYHRGLSAFGHTCPAGQSVYQQVEERLIGMLHQPHADDDQLDQLVKESKEIHGWLNEELHRGRDKLLEYNSCRPRVANRLRDEALDADENSELFNYLESVFDCYGIDTTEHMEKSHIILPGNQMQSGSFPGLHSEGMTITCDRDTALANEDMQFLTWEHPLVTGAMELVLDNELGNSSLSAIKLRSLKPGMLFLECLYVLESPSSDKLQSARYLPPTVIRTLIDQHGNDYSDTLTHSLIQQVRDNIDKSTALKIIAASSSKLREMLAISETLAQQRAPAILDEAHEQTSLTLSREIHRLEALQRVNPNVRNEEITFFRDQWDALNQALDLATIRLDAQRVIVTI